MTFNWVKMGLIIKPGKYKWMLTHAQNPFPEKITNDLYKIHFAGRNKYGYAQGGYVIININHPSKILKITNNPTLTIGELGCFDDCGVMPSCIVNYNNLQYMYYTGWTLRVATPFSFYIGLAISKNRGKTLQKISKAPVMGMSHIEPFMTCSPYVVFENNIWRMWYVSCTGWQGKRNTSKIRHFYHIKYTESKNGIDWNPQGTICIDYHKNEYAIARPIVYKDRGYYHMWYCYRGENKTYRAGYAKSKDGIRWERNDKNVGINTSSTGWDSQMICYPCVFKHEDNWYMLYNGNNYGKTGCGLAILAKGDYAQNNS